MLLSRLVFPALVAMADLVFSANYTNPLKSENGSDPFIVYYEGYYYLLTTTWTDVEITRATTLEGLKTGETKTVWADDTASRCCNVWAPELHEIDGTWYIYYSAGDADDLDGQRPLVLEGGSDPWDDDYTYVATLTNTWGIDGTVATINSQLYFIYSCFSGDLQSLCIAVMNSPTSIGDASVISEPTEDWETVGEPVNEGPAVVTHNGTTFMTYSASYCWTASYQLGLLTLTGDDPTLADSWTKSGPVFSSANGNYGTGHNGFFYSPDGTQIWNVYHADASSSGACDGTRYTMAEIVNWNSDGTPNFGVAPALDTVLEGPSGEPSS